MITLSNLCADAVCGSSHKGVGADQRVLGPIDGSAEEACDSHLDLGRASYVLYGVKYIDLVSLVLFLGVCAGT